MPSRSSAKPGRLIWPAAATLSLVLGFATVAVSQPVQPMRIVVGYAPGGGVDTMARILAEAIGPTLKRTVIVESKPGAGGQIAALSLKSSPADGSVVMLAPNGLTTVQTLVYDGKLKYDFAQDFAPVARVAVTDLAVAVASDLKIANVEELKAWLHAHPEKAFFATPAAGGLPHFVGLSLARTLGIDLTHVPFKGSAAAAIAVASGEVALAVGGIDDFIKLEADGGGKLKIIATLGARRSPVAPHVPTLTEQGVPLQTANWVALWAPAGTPEIKVQAIASAVQTALESDSVKRKLATAFTTPGFLTPADLAELQRADWARWRPVIKASGFTPEQ
jgi:tripartite-type tricarboxylate transporter receptor subunit TctC